MFILRYYRRRTAWIQSPERDALNLLQFYMIVFFHVEKADDVDGIEDDSIYKYIIVLF